MNKGKHYKVVSNTKKKKTRNKNVNNIENRSNAKIKMKSKAGTKTTNPAMWIIRILTIMIMLLCIYNVNGIISYFTDTATTTNEFSIIATYTITFKANDGTEAEEQREISYNVEPNLENSFTRTGYSFNGWNTKQDGSGTTYPNEESITNLGDITLYAQWLKIYNIEYDLNGGTLSTSNPTEYTVETSKFTLNNPTKTGYTFTGWSGTDLTDNENTSVTIPKGSTGDKEYTANWTANTYYIQFNSNDGTNTMSNQTMTYDVQKKLTVNQFSRSGYKFTGWNTESDGSGTSYTDGQSVSNLTATNEEIFNLYAQWALTVKYAVQIYGINQDVGKDGTTLGLTFGPATGVNGSNGINSTSSTDSTDRLLANYNNRYVTHTYGIINEDGTEVKEQANDDEEKTYNVVIVRYTVNSDGTETKKLSYLKDSSGKIVTRTPEYKAKYDINIHDMSWKNISEISSDKLKGPEVFTDCMLCGDTKSVEINLNSKIASGNVPTAYGDGAGTLSNTIKADYKKWNNITSNAREAGGYSSSRIRATLVGKESITYEGYEEHAGSDNLDLNTCLFSCIESDLQELIASKRVKYITAGLSSNSEPPTVLDPIWLFSYAEMCMSSSGTYALEGTAKIGTIGASMAYQKFNNPKSASYIITQNANTSSLNTRVTYSEAVEPATGSNYSWWLRSPNISVTGSAYTSTNTGNSSFVGASNDKGLSFGFCIK